MSVVELFVSSRTFFSYRHCMWILKIMVKVRFKSGTSWVCQKKLAAKLGTWHENDPIMSKWPCNHLLIWNAWDMFNHHTLQMHTSVIAHFYLSQMAVKVQWIEVQIIFHSTVPDHTVPKIIHFLCKMHRLQPLPVVARIGALWRLGLILGCECD